MYEASRIKQSHVPRRRLAVLTMFLNSRKIPREQENHPAACKADDRMKGRKYF